MLSLTCAQCKAMLSVDDAFAGGACRCQHCGTIQTVPRHLKGGGSAGAGGAQGAATASGRATQSKTLYTKQARMGGSSTGLEDLVGVVTSSGLRSARLRRESPDDGRRRRNAVFATCAGVIGALAMAVGYLFWAQNGQSSATPLAQSPVVGAIGTRGAAPAAPKAPDTPNFCGIALDDTSTVVYVLDRGDSARDLFGYLKSACYRSINSL